MEKLIDRGIQLVFAALLIGLPLLFLPDFSLPHELPKALVFRGLVLVLFLLVFSKIITSKEVFAPKLPKWIWLLFGGYFLTALISTFLSDIPELSFWGSYYRQQGFLQFLFYILFFFSVILYFSGESKIETEKKFSTAINLICIGGILAALYAIAEGFSYFRFRISGSLGQPNFLGMYLLMVLPFMVLNFYRNQKKRWLFVFWGFGIFVLLVAMFLTMSRAMFLGVLGGLFFLILVTRKWRVLAIMGILGLFVLFLNLFAGYSFIHDNIFLSRFIFEGWAFNSVKARFLIWDGMIDLIKLKPIFGYGPEMLMYAFKPFTPVDLFHYEILGTYVDRAHNEILDVTANYGLVGLLFYFSFFVGVLKLAYKKVKEPLVEAVFFSLISLFVANLFSFSVNVHLMFWWILLGILLVITGKSIAVKINLYKSKFLRNFLIVILIIACIFSINFLTVRPILADFYFAKGDYDKVYYFNPHETFYPLYRIEGILSDAQDSQDRNNLLIEAENLLDNFVQKHSKNFPEILFWRGKIAHLRDDHELAIQYFELAYKQNPKNRSLALMWARSLRQLKQYDLAVKKFEEYLDLTPYWKWIDRIDQKTEVEKTQFLLFFEYNLGFVSEMLELIETSRSAEDKEKEAYYTDHRERILEFLRYSYRDI